MNLCIDAMRTLFTMPGLSTFVLITGDRDFIPLVNSIRQQGKDVIIIGVGGAASSHLAQSADEFIFYEQLVGKAEATAPKTEPRKSLDADDFERPVRERERISVSRQKPERKESTSLSEDESFDLLVKVVLEARSRRMVTGIGSLKTLMRELSNGDFRESTIRDGNGRPIEKFKDFITEAARRGKIIISTEGVVNEVFLPGEDPKALSQFNNSDSTTDRKDEEAPSPTALAPERLSGTVAGSADKSRRRRRRGERAPERPASTKTELSSPKTNSAAEGELSIPTAHVVPIVAAVRAEPAAPRDGAEDEPNGESTLIATPFSDEERRSVRDIVAASERPMSFQQIYDTLRGSRNRGGDSTISRTNEDLRSLVKLSINAGELQRIGRGNRVSYRIAPAVPLDQIVADDTNIAASDAAGITPPIVVATVKPTRATPQMIPTPQDQGDDGLALPTVSANQHNRRRTKQPDVQPTPVPSELAPPTEQKRRGPKPKAAYVPVVVARPVVADSMDKPKKPAGRDGQRSSVSKTPPAAPVKTPSPAAAPTPNAKPRRRKQNPEA